MTTLTLRNPGTRNLEPKKPIGPGKTGVSVEAADLESGAWRRHAVESCLEGGFLPETSTLSSFLVNALYLFGDNTIAVYGGAPEGVTDELTRLGHRVTTGPFGRDGRDGRSGAGGARGDGGNGSAQREFAPRREGRHDRAVLMAQAFGRGGDAEILEGLRNLRRALRPGGLLCFHIFDRDRAWNLAGERDIAAEGRRAKVRIGFNPDDGRITARLADVVGPDGPEAPGCGGLLAVKAWNRPEIETLLRSAGLRPERIYGDWEGGGPDAAGGRLIVVAAKPRRARRNRNGKGDST